MTDAERSEAARQFVQRWTNKGKEDEDDRSYWIELLQYVLGVDHVTERIEFQKKVVGPDGNVKRIDAYIPETRVLIEQKSLNVDLSKPQAGHNGMTPYEQAKMYDNSLPLSEKAKWIVVSNFRQIWVYDMDSYKPEPKQYDLLDIHTKTSLFSFLVNKEEKKLSEEMEVSIKAGEYVGLLYDAFLEQYHNPESEESLRSLNMLCVRLVFCLYAEDAHIFGNSGHMFHDYMAQFDTKGMRKALIELFKTLDIPEDKRDSYDESLLSQFPYVNGGLFADENIEIPNFTDEIRDILLDKASAGFDWSVISPTIFGAVFESTLNPETRRSGGMHYTSIENIHKVIDPLFLDDLKAELLEIKQIQMEKTRNTKLKAFQEKLASLTWLDPACGSGNFLTETYLSIRRLENEVISLLKSGQMAIMDAMINPIEVEISQFYGIEINDFAVTVAKTALWIAESQMLKETEKILIMDINFLPLKTNANIVEGNALQIDWLDVVPKEKLNYIMGNPPFVGARNQSEQQKKDILNVCIDRDGNSVKRAGFIDYVGGWYYKAAQFIYDTRIACAFVSTNSICQGEQVEIIWKNLFEKYNIKIHFAYQTFVWNSEATNVAHVHCVIVGFAVYDKERKMLWDSSSARSFPNHINAYLLDAPDCYIQRLNKPLCEVPIISNGNRAYDGNNLVMTSTEKDELISKEPLAQNYILPYYMGADLMKGQPRYVLWLLDCSPADLKKMPLVMKRVKAVQEMRNMSSSASTKKAAATPTLFQTICQPKSSYIGFPRVSSSRRDYIPMTFLDSKTICGDKLIIIPGADNYVFGVLMSNVHNAWIRVVSGRLKSDIEYSSSVYNNFPWPTITDDQKAKIEQTAQGILDARALYPDSSLADLYDPLAMPQELRKAHIENDKAVMRAYGFSIKDMSESDCVAALMKMYQKIVLK